MSATTSNRQTKQQRPKGRPREGSVVWAMIHVLDGKRKPMTPAEILAEIQKRGLAKKLAGKTPEASVAARLAVHIGIYFERPEKGKYQLKKGITAKTITHQTTSNDSGSKRKSTDKKPSSTAARRRSSPGAGEPTTAPTSESGSELAAAPPAA